MRFPIHPELKPVIAAAAEIAAQVQRPAIEPADLLLAFCRAIELPVGQKFGVCKLSLRQLEDECLAAESTGPVPEQPEFGRAALALFSQAVDPATFFGRRQISAADLAATMACDNAVIGMLIRAGLDPRGYNKLQDDLIALAKIQRDGDPNESPHAAVEKTVH